MSRILQGRINTPVSDGVVFGPGSAGTELAGLLREVGSSRPFLVTTPSVAKAGLVGAVREAAEVELAGEFARSEAHTPREVVLALAEEMAAAGADGVISLGGSSVVDLAKGGVLVMAEGADLDAHMMRYSPDTGPQVPPLTAPKVPHIAITTTLSGAEFTGAAGITDRSRGEKDIYIDPKLCPKFVILDPELARATPAELWAGTGMKIVADSLEVLCSTRATPYTDALALGTLALLHAELPAATADADDVAARGRCLFAAFMLLPNLLNVGLGITAAFRHQIGAGHGVDHGIASTIMLPHVLAWNRDHAGDQLARAARELRVDGGAEGLIGAVTELVRKLGLPANLGAVGVGAGDLGAIADHASHDFVVATNPRPVTGPADLVPILEAAL